ncbi:hypothetical protein EVAR_56213_1 [Eumeta japonica]|uniref:Uncharacterized protein n=1 Tax=Eumeta variegata TaxID=151549 RepID=A0A4C1YWE0_EUMVA|nr:hypothetical protein EVAR_56213_1 [Eumeta japonica]
MSNVSKYSDLNGSSFSSIFCLAEEQGCTSNSHPSDLVLLASSRSGLKDSPYHRLQYSPYCSLWYEILHHTDIGAQYTLNLDHDPDLAFSLLDKTVSLSDSYVKGT